MKYCVRLTIFFIFHVVHGFNIDVENPIIITNSFNGRKSQFGATVTLVTGSKPGSNDTSWIVIGAPKANSSIPSQANIAEPGVLWRCSLGKTSDTCELLTFDDKGNSVQEHHGKGGEVVNRKDGAWLGGTSFLGESNRFVTCAPRWANQRAANITALQQNQSHYFMNGICYWRPKEHILESEVPALLPNHTLIPLRDSDRQGTGETYAYDWIFGEAGFSIYLTKENEMIMGAPGVADWKGSVIRFSDNTSYPRLRRNGRKEEFGEMFQAKPLISRPELDPRLKMSSTYFGYAVTAGKYFGSNTRSQFAAAAPRGGLERNLTGHVTIFNFPEDDNQPLQKLQEIDGPMEIGSYFGSVLCSVDLNNDNYVDLLVGAPRFSARTVLILRQSIQVQALNGTGAQAKPISSAFTGYGDEGIVFVYMSDGIKMNAPIRISGGNKHWSRFGSAITSLGDINHDGYNDVAIGAPQQDSNRGAVYIYLGGKMGLSKLYSQMILAKDLNSQLLGFGSSFSLGIDIDKNDYNDLAVGAFSSEQAVLLRARPVVRITGSLTSATSKLPITMPDLKFDFESCVYYTGYSAPPNLKIQVQLVSDADSKLGRVHIETQEASGSTNQSLKYITNVGLNDQVCRTFTAVVHRRLTLSQRPIVIRQEVLLEDETKPQALRSTQYNIKRDSFGSSVSGVDISGLGFNKFCKTCPVRDLTVGNQESLSLPLGLPCGEDDVCVSDLTIEATFNGIEQDTFLIGSSPKLVLHVVIANSAEAAISPGVTISWMKRNLAVRPPNCEQAQSTKLSCTLGEILKSGVDEKKHIFFEFDMSDLIAGDQNTPKEFIVTIEATTASNVTAVAKLDKILIIKAKADISVFGGQETVLLNPINPAQVLRHKYNITLDGPSTVNRVELFFDIPLNVHEGPNILPVVNLTQITAEHDGQTMNCRASLNGASLFPLDASPLLSGFDPDLDGIPSFRTEVDQIGRDLRKRDVSGVEKEVEPEITRSKRKADTKLGVKNGEIELDCFNELVECASVTCLVNKFKPGETVTVEFSMKVSPNDTKTFLKKHSARRVKIQSLGKAVIANIDEIQPLNHKPDSYNASTTMSLDVDGIPQWVYPASIVSALLILACITLCLCALGVFSRKKKPQPEPDAPAAVELQESLPLRATSIEEEDEEVVDDVFTRESYGFSLKK